MKKGRFTGRKAMGLKGQEVQHRGKSDSGKCLAFWEQWDCNSL